MSIHVTAFDHIVLCVADVDRTREFYQWASRASMSPVVTSSKSTFKK
jgi:hypothetical protein